MLFVQCRGLRIRYRFPGLAGIVVNPGWEIFYVSNFNFSRCDGLLLRVEDFAVEFFGPLGVGIHGFYCSGKSFVLAGLFGVVIIK